MNSSEEYLDNLLKAMLEGGNKAEPESGNGKADTPEALFASIGDMSEGDDIAEDTGYTEKRQEKSASVEANKAMSTDEIEEMFATMSDGIVTASSVLTGMPAADGQDSEDIALDEKASLEETAPEEILALEEEILPDGSDEEVLPAEDEGFPDEPVTEDTSFTKEWALEEDNLPDMDELAAEEIPPAEEWSMADDSFPGEPVAEEWALEETLPDDLVIDESSSLEEWAEEENNLPDEPIIEETPPMEEWMSEDDTLSAESVIDENFDIEEWALGDNSLPEEFGQEEDSVGWPLEGSGLMEEQESEESYGSDGGRPLEENNPPEESYIEGIPGVEDKILEENSISEDTEAERASGLEEWFMGKNNLAEESGSEEVLGSEEWSSEENNLADELDLEEVSGSEEWPLEENTSAEESDLEEGSDLEEWSLEENSPADEPDLEGGSDLEGWPPEENSSTEEPGLGELSGLEERAPEENDMPEEPEPEEIPNSGEWESLDDVLSEESSLPDGWALDDDVFSGNMETEDNFSDQILNDLSSMETEQISDDLSLEGRTQEAADSKKSELDDLLEDLKSVDSEFENFKLEKEDTAMGDSMGTMSEEDIDRLLGDNFESETAGDGDEGLSELLESMGHDDDLSAINDLLEKADQGSMEDDEMLALLEEHSSGDTEESDDEFDFWGKDESIQKGSGSERDELESSDELTSSKDENKKKEKKKKKNKKDNEAGEKEKSHKQGFFGRLMETLLEDEDDLQEESASGGVVGELGSLSDENQELLDELNAEDKKNAKKKGKKEKKKKEPKKKKDDGKAKKAPKPKKPKKEKKVKKTEPEVPEKRISRTKIIFVVIFCGTIAVAIIVVNMFIPDYMQRQEAKDRYSAGEYEEAYDLLYGKELNEEEEAILQKSNVILQVKRKWNSYENYSKLGMTAEALNALIEGVDFYHMFVAEAQQYGVTGEVDEIYGRILAELSGSYGVSEEDALNVIASEDDLSYSGKLYSILNGTGVGSGDEDLEEQPKVKQDVLPEEEEIIDRLENPDLTGEPDIPEESDLSEESGVTDESDLLDEEVEGDL